MVTFIGSKLFGDNGEAKKLEEAKQKFAEMADKVRDFNEAASGFDMSGVVTAIRQVRRDAVELWQAAIRAQDFSAANQIALSYISAIQVEIRKFANPGVGLSDAAKSIGDLQLGAQQLVAELNRLGFAWADQSEIMRGVQTQIEEIQRRARASLQADINEATGRGFINEFVSLLDKFNQLKREANITGVDSSLIDRWFRVQAQKIVDGAELTGDAFNELAAMFPELTGVVHESTAAIEEQAKAQLELQKQFDQAAKQIVNYVSDLRTGEGTSLSPTARLSRPRARSTSRAGWRRAATWMLWDASRRTSRTCARRRRRCSARAPSIRPS